MTIVTVTLVTLLPHTFATEWMWNRYLVPVLSPLMADPDPDQCNQDLGEQDQSHGPSAFESITAGLQSALRLGSWIARNLPYLVFHICMYPRVIWIRSEAAQSFWKRCSLSYPDARAREERSANLKRWIRELTEDSVLFVLLLIACPYGEWVPRERIASFWWRCLFTFPTIPATIWNVSEAYIVTRQFINELPSFCVAVCRRNPETWSSTLPGGLTNFAEIVAYTGDVRWQRWFAYFQAGIACLPSILRRTYRMARDVFSLIALIVNLVFVVCSAICDWLFTVWIRVQYLAFGGALLYLAYMIRLSTTSTPILHVSQSGFSEFPFATVNQPKDTLEALHHQQARRAADSLHDFYTLQARLNQAQNAIDQDSYDIFWLVIIACLCPLAYALYAWATENRVRSAEGQSPNTDHAEPSHTGPPQPSLPADDDDQVDGLLDAEDARSDDVSLATAVQHALAPHPTTWTRITHALLALLSELFHFVDVVKAYYPVWRWAVAGASPVLLTQWFLKRSSVPNRITNESHIYQIIESTPSPEVRFIPDLIKTVDATTSSFSPIVTAHVVLPAPVPSDPVGLSMVYWVATIFIAVAATSTAVYFILRRSVSHNRLQVTGSSTELANTVSVRCSRAFALLPV